MKGGTVYVMTFKAFPNLVKVGRTRASLAARVDGVSREYGSRATLAYGVSTEHYEKLEKDVHCELHGMDRHEVGECFRATVDETVEIFQKLLNPAFTLSYWANNISSRKTA